MRMSTDLVFSYPEFPRVELVMSSHRDGFNYEWQYGDGSTTCCGWLPGTLEQARAGAVSQYEKLRVAAAKLLGR